MPSARNARPISAARHDGRGGNSSAAAPLLLVTPGNVEAKMMKPSGLTVDVLMIDLEGSVFARGAVRVRRETFLAVTPGAGPHPQDFPIRVNLPEMVEASPRTQCSPTIRDDCPESSA